MKKLLISAGYEMIHQEEDHQVWENDFATIHIGESENTSEPQNHISFGHNENGYFEMEDVSESEIRVFVELFSNVKFNGKYYGSDDPAECLIIGMDYWFKRVKQLSRKN